MNALIYDLSSLLSKEVHGDAAHMGVGKTHDSQNRSLIIHVMCERPPLVMLFDPFFFCIT